MKIRDIYFGYISVLKRHYVVMIILPIYLVFNGILRFAYEEDKYPILSEIMRYFSKGLFLLFIFLPILFLFKRKRMTALYLFLTPIITVVVTTKLLTEYGLDENGIYFFIHREEYQHIIENSPSMATNGGLKLVKIKLPHSWYACEKYLVYDESDEMSNKRGNFRGIGYLYIQDINGNSKLDTDVDVYVKKYAEHTYIANVCEDTGQ